MKVAVVILNWNGKKFLEKFLPFVIRYSEHAEIIVADNASTDDSVAFLKIHHPEIRIIQNPTNGGFAKGYNDALKQVNADYYILLNSDIEITHGWIEPVIAMMEKDKTIGACQPKILSYADREHFEYAGAAGGFIDKYGYPFCRGRIFQSLEKDNEQYNDTIEVFWATGACMFVRASIYHEIGGLDEKFFAHMEEIDFCWRMKQSGYKIMYCPESKVYHIGGGTLPKISYRKTYLNFRNNLFMLFKNHPTEKIIPILLTRFILDGVAGLKFFIDGGFKDCYAVTRAHFSFYRNLPALYRDRKKINHTNVSMIYQKNLVVEYFIRKKDTFNKMDLTKFS